MPTSVQAAFVNYIQKMLKTWDFRMIVYSYVIIIETNSSVIGIYVQSSAVEHYPARLTQKQLG